MGPSLSTQLNDSDSLDQLAGYPITEPFREPERKLTRKERRAFKQKLKKPKYQKLAKKVIESKSKK